MAAAVVRRVGVFSWAKITALIYAMIGLIVGSILALVSLFGVALGSTFDSGSSDFGRFVPALLGVGAIVFVPLLYGLLGFFGGLLVAGLFNLAAGMTGGLEIELAEPRGAGPAPPPAAG
jgi:hypothetical protein